MVRLCFRKCSVESWVAQVALRSASPFVQEKILSMQHVDGDRGGVAHKSFAVLVNVWFFINVASFSLIVSDVFVCVEVSV